jgi:hypothetical protein
MLVNGKTIEEILRENDEKMKTKKEHMKLFDLNKQLVNTYSNYEKENNVKKDLRNYLNKFYDKSINNQFNIKKENEYINSNKINDNQNKEIEYIYKEDDVNKRLYPNLFKKKDLIKRKFMSINNTILKNKNKQKNKSINKSKSINYKNIKPIKNIKRNSKRNNPLSFNYPKTNYLNNTKPVNFFQNRIMKSRKIDGKTDNVTLYHMHNSEWSKNYILNEMKQNEKLSYGYINYCPYI